MDQPSPPTGVPSGFPAEPVGVALPDVHSHMSGSILSMLCCFPPAGIVAIIDASPGHACRSAGDGAGALHASSRAPFSSIAGPVVSAAGAAVIGLVEVATRMRE